MNQQKKQQRKALGIVERVYLAERAVNAQAARLKGLDRALQAVIEVVGEGAVRAAFATMRLREAEEEAAGNDGELERGKEAGYIVAREAAASDSIVVCSETAPDGTVVPRRHLAMATLAPPLAEALVGKGAGHEFPAAPGSLQGSTAKVLEVWAVDGEKFEAWRKEQVLKEQAAAAAAKALAEKPAPEAAEDSEGETEGDGEAAQSSEDDGS